MKEMKDKYDILVVDDELGMREGVRRVLGPYGHNVSTAQNCAEAMKLLDDGSFDLALLDMRLPDGDGLSILDVIKQQDPLTVCIMITAYATLDTAVDATKRGAFDYLAKPFTADQLLTVVDRALDRRDLLVEADILRQERDRSLLELSREKTRLGTIIRCMADGVIVTNRDGEIVLFNSRGSRFLKDHLTVTPGTPFREKAVSEDMVEMVETAGDPSLNREVAGREISLGEETHLANCATLRDEEGGFLGTVTVLRDISHIKELERAKARFVSMVTHDLRAPVAAIKGYLDIIVKKAAGNDPGVYDQMILRSRDRAEGLLDLIRDLLDMSRIDGGKVERQIGPVDLEELLRNNAEFFKNDAQARDLSIILDLPDTELTASADTDELNRIITNLLSNAIKYNRPGGTITITAGSLKDQVQFSVEDTGIGMTPQEQERLFEDFYRAANPQARKQTGTGLGLAITRRLVEANFGRIDVDSSWQKGTKFTVTLPGKS